MTLTALPMLLIEAHQTWKLWTAETTSISNDALHVLLALLIQFVVAQFYRRRVASFGPLLWLAAFELANESFDLVSYLVHDEDLGMWRFDSANDVLVTMLAPTALCLLLRRAPGRLLPAGPTVAAAED